MSPALSTDEPATGSRFPVPAVACVSFVAGVALGVGFAIDLGAEFIGGLVILAILCCVMAVLLRIAAKLHAVTLPALRYAELAGRWIFDRRPLDQIDKPPPKYTPIRRTKSPNQLELNYA